MLFALGKMKSLMYEVAKWIGRVWLDRIKKSCILIASCFSCYHLVQEAEPCQGVLTGKNLRALLGQVRWLEHGPSFWGEFKMDQPTLLLLWRMLSPLLASLEVSASEGEM